MIFFTYIFLNLAFWYYLQRTQNTSNFNKFISPIWMNFYLFSLIFLKTLKRQVDSFLIWKRFCTIWKNIFNLPRIKNHSQTNLKKWKSLSASRAIPRIFIFTVSPLSLSVAYKQVLLLFHSMQRIERHWTRNRSIWKRDFFIEILIG